MELNVRRARQEDIPRLLALLTQVDMVHHRGRPDLFNGPAVKYGAQELGALLADGERPVFVCENENGLVLGHLFCEHRQITGSAVMTDVKTLYIDDICVDEACRGQGVGKTLYRFAERYAAENGFYNITLNVWCCNPGALRFYEAMGMRPQKIGMETVLPGREAPDAVTDQKG